MQKCKKRYAIYRWSLADLDSYYKDYDLEAYDAFSCDLTNIMDYGEKIGEADTEEEANKIAVENNSNNYLDGEISIYDYEERKWFN